MGSEAKSFTFLLILALVYSDATLPIWGEEGRNDQRPPEGKAVIWKYPADISRRNLFYGPGGESKAPTKGPFTFIAEDLDDTQPKYDVRDPNGVQWKIKLGSEARPETVATRLVWAVGYFADEDYFLPRVTIANLPAKLHRGAKYFDRTGTVMNARLERARDTEKVGTWNWRKNPFANSRELNGLRVITALMNNWDLADSNNMIVREKDSSGEPILIYFVSDVGTTFGGTGFRLPGRQLNGNLQAYQKTKFITKTTPQYVSFRTPTQPSIMYFTVIPLLYPRVRTWWIGRHIPREDVKWIGSLLAQLSQNQIRDAFRAAGYTTKEVDGFSEIVQSRIAALNDL